MKRDEKEWYRGSETIGKRFRLFVINTMDNRRREAFFCYPRKKTGGIRLNGTRERNDWHTDDRRTDRD